MYSFYEMVTNFFFSAPKFHTHLKTIDNPGQGDCGFYAFAVGLMLIPKDKRSPSINELVQTNAELWEALHTELTANPNLSTIDIKYKPLQQQLRTYLKTKILEELASYQSNDINSFHARNIKEGHYIYELFQYLSNSNVRERQENILVQSKVLEELSSTMNQFIRDTDSSFEPFLISMIFKNHKHLFDAAIGKYDTSSWWASARDLVRLGNHLHINEFYPDFEPLKIIEPGRALREYDLCFDRSVIILQNQGNFHWVAKRLCQSSPLLSSELAAKVIKSDAEVVKPDAEVVKSDAEVVKQRAEEPKPDAETLKLQAKWQNLSDSLQKIGYILPFTWKDEATHQHLRQGLAEYIRLNNLYQNINAKRLRAPDYLQRSLNVLLEDCAQSLEILQPLLSGNVNFKDVLARYMVRKDKRDEYLNDAVSPFLFDDFELYLRDKRNKTSLKTQTPNRSTFGQRLAEEDLFGQNNFNKESQTSETNKPQNQHAHLKMSSSLLFAAVADLLVFVIPGAFDVLSKALTISSAPVLYIFIGICSAFLGMIIENFIAPVLSDCSEEEDDDDPFTCAKF